MPFPNFFIIGSPKCGSTSLYHYLKQHPDIFMSPVKEPHFFIPEEENKRIIKPETAFLFTKSFKEGSNVPLYRDLERYLSLFNGVENEKIIGEASVTYLAYTSTATHIYKEAPRAKLIAILRNPFDAAYSCFIMRKRDGIVKTDTTFLEMLKSEDIYNKDLSFYPRLIRVRFYDDYLDHYFNTFPKDQIRVFLHKDLKDSQRLCKDIFNFLGVDETFAPNTDISHNTTQTYQQYPFPTFLDQIPQSIRDKLSYFLPKPLFQWYMEKRLGNRIERDHFKISKKCPNDAKEFLYPIFEPHILRLQDMINRDLSAWLA